jgi:sortase (surface protein transpeptidase)
MTIDIPAIKVHAPVVRVGLTPSNAVAVPPVDKPYETGWYRRSAAPGDDGAAVILGHVTAATGPAVFFNLSKLRPGDTVTVARKGHGPVTFTVDGIREYHKTALPLARIYGPLPYPGLRLITCGGPVNTGHYRDNVVVYASMTPGAARSGWPGG